MGSVLPQFWYESVRVSVRVSESDVMMCSLTVERARSYNVH